MKVFALDPIYNKSNSFYAQTRYKFYSLFALDTAAFERRLCCFPTESYKFAIAEYWINVIAHIFLRYGI